MTENDVHTTVRVTVASHELVLDDLVLPVVSLLPNDLLAVSGGSKEGTPIRDRKILVKNKSSG